VDFANLRILQFLFSLISLGKRKGLDGASGKNEKKRSKKSIKDLEKNVYWI